MCTLDQLPVCRKRPLARWCVMAGSRKHRQHSGYPEGASLVWLSRVQFHWHLRPWSVLREHSTRCRQRCWTCSIQDFFKVGIVFCSSSPYKKGMENSTVHLLVQTGLRTSCGHSKIVLVCHIQRTLRSVFRCATGEEAGQRFSHSRSCGSMPTKLPCRSQLTYWSTTSKQWPGK